MAHSAVLTSKSAFLTSQGILLVVQEPLKKIRMDLKSANNVFALIQEIVVAYCSSFSAISSTRQLWYLKHSLPIPPVVVNTKGVKVLCSTWRTLLKYRCFFSFHVSCETVIYLFSFA